MVGGREAADPSSVGTPLQGFETEDEQRFAAALAEAIPDILPETIRAERGLMHRAEAFRAFAYD